MKKKIGRPSSYSDELAYKICERLSYGETLRSICLDPAMPSLTTIFRWEEVNPKFRELSARAREKGTHQLADECIAIADDPNLEPHDKRIRIDTRLRLIGKWNAKRYGEKIEVEQNGEQTIRIRIGGDRPTDFIDVKAVPVPALQNFIETDATEETEND
jgi:hypothetical protein